VVVLSVQFAGTSEVAHWCTFCAATVVPTGDAEVLRPVDSDITP
jgi:hypothetical protein